MASQVVSSELRTTQTFVARLRTKYQRTGPSPIVNDGTKIGLDLNLLA